MKCEFLYMVHENTRIIKSTTLKELLILIPIATCFVIFSNVLCLGNKILWIMLLTGVCVCLILSLKDAIKYCKNKKE